MSEEQQGPPVQRPRTICDGPRLREAFQAGVSWVEAHCEEINGLNVFPVPDGDTGTNMLLTCRAAVEEMERAGDSAAEVMHAAAHGSLMGARGNSGVILSQILRGMARSLGDKKRLTNQDMALALREGANTAYKAVIKPVEGTILTVIRETADAAMSSAQKSDNLVELLGASVRACRASVRRTPTLLPALRQAGVVDAGGHGLLILLEGVQRYVQGESVAVGQVARAQFNTWHAPEEGYGYDIQFLLHGDGLDVDGIRAHIVGMGDSALIVGDERTIKVHVHCPNPGPVLDYAARLGPLSRVIIENMQEQYTDFSHAEQAGAPAEPAAPGPGPAQRDGISTVVVVAGRGLEKVFKSLEATAIVSGGQTMNPSTQEILQAIESVPTDQVIVLPNNKNIVLTAEQARSMTGKTVVIVPTTTIPQGIAALLSLNAESDLYANKESMQQAAGAVRTGEVTRAVRDSHANGVVVRKGQVIGLLDDALEVAGEQVNGVAEELLERMDAAGAELLTIYYGEGIDRAEATQFAEEARRRYPGAQVDLMEGNQPHYMYILSAE